MGEKPMWGHVKSEEIHLCRVAQPNAARCMLCASVVGVTKGIAKVKVCPCRR